jgi:hypothetical protein
MRLAQKWIQILTSRHQKAGERHSIKIANRSFEVMAKFEHLGTIPTDENCMREEIKSRLNWGNACYHSVQCLLSSRLLSRNWNVKICKTIILPAVLYGCETWSLTLSEEYRLTVVENRVLRRIFGPKRDEVTGEWRKLHNGELHNFYLSRTSLSRSNQGERSGRGMWHAWENVWSFRRKAWWKETTRNTEA